MERIFRVFEKLSHRGNLIGDYSNYANIVAGMARVSYKTIQNIYFLIITC